MPNQKLVDRYSKQIKSLEEQIVGITKKIEKASTPLLKQGHQKNLDFANSQLEIAKKNLEEAKKEDCDNSSYILQKDKEKALSKKLSVFLPKKTARGYRGKRHIGLLLY